MGWTYTRKPKHQTVADFFRNAFEHDNERGTGKILDCAVVGLSEVYMAYEKTVKETGERYVVALVCLIRFSRDPHYNFGYKDMDENMGPGASRCPERILALLTPTDSENASEWRERCRKRVAAAKARPSIRKGDVLVFPRDIEFPGGWKVRRFTAVEPARGTYRSDSGCLCKLRRSTTRETPYEIHRSGAVLRVNDAT